MSTDRKSSIQGHSGEVFVPFKGEHLKLGLSPDVASPNHYTNLMLNHLARCDFSGMTVLDIGCGSGVLALIASRYLGASIVHAVDISPSAVRLTARNRDLNGCSDDAIRPYVWDVRSGLPDYPFDVIVANLPQIPTPETDRDVMCSGGPSGRELIELVIRSSVTTLSAHNSKLLMVIADFVGIPALEELARDIGLTVKIDAQEIARPGTYTNRYLDYIERSGHHFDADEFGRYFVLNLISFRGMTQTPDH